MEHETLSLPTPFPTRSVTRGSSPTRAVSHRTPSLQRASSRAIRVERSPSYGSTIGSCESARTLGQHQKTLAFLELLFGSLRAESLLIATLAYGLAVKTSTLRSLRIRDVSISDGSIVISNQLYAIPGEILDDLREFLHERMCGCEAHEASERYPNSSTFSVRDAQLFSSAAFSVLDETVRSFGQFLAPSSDPLCSTTQPRSLDSLFRVLGWLHRRALTRSGAPCASALEIFDKGPRIVRRRRAGVLDAYYVWRAYTHPRPALDKRGKTYP